MRLLGLAVDRQAPAGQLPGRPLERAGPPARVLPGRDAGGLLGAHPATLGDRPPLAHAVSRRRREGGAGQDHHPSAGGWAACALSPMHSPPAPCFSTAGSPRSSRRAATTSSSALWSARLLRDDPAAVVAAHAAFAAAGAQVATTASYQATVEGFGAAGVDAAEARRLIASSSRAGPREGQGEGWVAGSVGPYGAMLADGSEYTGDYVDELGVPGLRAFHRPRMELLAEAGADVLACETVPAAAEAEALIAEADALGVPLLAVADHGGRRRGSAAPAGASSPPTSSRWRPAPTRDRRRRELHGARRRRPLPSRLRQSPGSRSSSTPTAARAGTPSTGPWTGTPGIATDDVPSWVGRRVHAWSAAAAASARNTSPRSPPPSPR